MRKNEEIDATSVRLVNPDGSHEVLPTAVALQRANVAGLDLVEVSPGTRPPVARLMNFADLEKSKRVKERENEKRLREHQRQEKTREIRLTPRISPHDLEMKIRKITEFLEKRQRVNVFVMTPSRGDKKMGHEALQYIRTLLADKAKLGVEPGATRHGTVSMTLLPLADTKESR